MAWNSETAREAGRKGRRGKQKHAGQLRDMLMQELDTGRLRYALSELDSVQYVKAMGTLMQYAVPRLQAIQIATVEDIEGVLTEMSLVERSRIANKLIELAGNGQ